MNFTQAQIDATAKELCRHVSIAGNTSTDDRWEDYRDVAHKALEAGHLTVPEMTVHLSPGTRVDSDTMITLRHWGGNTVRGTVEQVLGSHLAKGWKLDAGPERRVPLNEGEQLQEARNTFERWLNGDGSELELAGALGGLIESYSPAPEAGEALELLDTLNESGRMRYDDYVELHGIVSQLQAPEPSETEEALRAALQTPDPSEALSRAVQSFASIAKMAEWWHGAADRVLERLRTETTQDVMLYHDAVSVLVSARSVFRIAEVHAQGAPEEQNPTDEQVLAAIRTYRNRDPQAFAAEWMPDVLRSAL